MILQGLECQELIIKFVRSGMWKDCIFGKREATFIQVAEGA